MSPTVVTVADDHDLRRIRITSRIGIIRGILGQNLWDICDSWGRHASSGGMINEIG